MSAATDLTHIARQPILDARGQVYGYELLHRASADNVSARVISDIVNGPGFDAVTDGKRAFLNLSADVQMWNVAGLLDPERVVLEIPASVAVTPEVLAACADLQRRGYDLALDGFAEDSPGEALLPHVRFAKLRVGGAGGARLGPDHPAPRTRRHRDRREGRNRDGAHRGEGGRLRLFQGYYFCRPETFAVKAMSASQLTQMQLFAALMRPNVSLAAIEDLLSAMPRCPTGCCAA